jgi:hypothetical protein
VSPRFQVPYTTSEWSSSIQAVSPILSANNRAFWRNQGRIGVWDGGRERSALAVFAGVIETIKAFGPPRPLKHNTSRL